jgi:hypothetical protein
MRSPRHGDKREHQERVLLRKWQHPNTAPKLE